MTTPQQIEAKAEELRVKIITCKEANDHAVIGDFLTSFAAEVRAETMEEKIKNVGLPDQVDLLLSELKISRSYAKPIIEKRLAEIWNEWCDTFYDKIAAQVREEDAKMCDHTIGSLRCSEKIRSKIQL